MIKSRKTKNTLFRRIGLASSSLGALAALANTSLAQDSTDATVDRVVVTGSSIPTAAEVTAAPLDVVDQAAVSRSGTQDVLSVLQRSNPGFTGSGNLGQTNANIASGSTGGGSSIALRNLPTLVLLNGRRVADASAAAAGGLVFSDVNLFPVTLVKRIEVLKDGASAIYGSDAIGGVVNVILDQDFTGVQINARYGFAEKGDITEQRYSALVGVGDAKTHLVFGAQYLENDPIFSRTRQWARGSFGTTTYGGTARGTNAGYYVLNPALNSPSDVNPTPSTTGGAIPAAGNILAGGTSVNGAATGTGLAAGTYLTSNFNAVLTGFDLSNATTITLDQNRKSYFTSFERELFEKYVSIFGDFLYSDNYSQSQLNAQPLSNATGVVIPATAPFNPFGRTIDTSTLGGNDRLQINNRFTANPRIFRNDTNFYRFVAGFKGEIVKNYTYETAANYSKNQTNFRNFNLINGDNLNPAIAGGFDAAGNAVVGGPFSMVNGNLQPALDFFSRNPSNASLNGLLATDVRDLETSQFIYDARIVAFPFELPAGPIGISAGFEFRYESLKATIDPQQIFLGSVPVADIDASRDIHSFYGELQIPVVSPAMHVPGVYAFDINGAVRFDDYTDAGQSTIPKAGFRYQPIEDVTVRGSFSKSFIAPTLYQTQGPQSTGFSPGETLNGVQQDQAQITSGSNPALSPSEAETYSAGIVISPHWTPGLTLNADYFNVRQTDIVGSVGAQAIVTSVESQGTASPYAGNVRVGSFNGAPVTGPGQLSGNFSSLFITDTLQNLGGQKLQGFDFGANYNLDLKSFGTFTFGVNGTYYIKYQVKLLPTDEYFRTEGRFSVNNGSLPDYRLVPFVEYKYGGFTTSALGNYIPSMHDAGGVDLSTYKRSNDGRLPKIRDYYTIDVLASYEFGLGKPDATQPPPPPSPKDAKDGKDFKSTTAHKDVVEQLTGKKWYEGIRMAAGIRNVTNARPPFILNTTADNTDTATYDPYQRFYYFELSKKF